MDETTEKVIKVSVLTPLIYVGAVMTCFVVFVVIHRRRKLAKLAHMEPIFAENYPLSLYLFLKQQYTDPNVAKESKPHERVMKAALLRRGVEAIRRSLKLKEVEPSYNRLYQEGLIGDETFKNFQFQAKFQELEIKEIVQECESYKKGWVQQFFPVAQEICFNEALRRRLSAMDERSKTLCEQWQLLAAQSEREKAPEKAEAPTPPPASAVEPVSEKTDR
ncbi:Translocation protein SEC66 [[Candida] zeylanoides]